MSQGDFLRTFDGLKARTIFCFWFGPFNLMSGNRIVALNSIFQRVAVPVCLVSDHNVGLWEHPDRPFHPAWRCLSAVHKSDYFRAYFMSTYGGGYTDIKSPRATWASFFNQLDENSDHWALGYTELRPTGIALTEDGMGALLRENYKELIGMCSYVMRKNTILSNSHLENIEIILESKSAELLKYPASEAYDNSEGLFTGRKTSYPLRWTVIGSEVFHPILFRNKLRLIKNDQICPMVTNYR